MEKSGVSLPQSERMGQTRFDKQKRRRKSIVVIGILALTTFCYYTLDTTLVSRHLNHTHETYSKCTEERWIERQGRISYEKILRNIGPIAGAKDGLVIASPSHGKDNQPDYYYTWTRDSGLTIKTLLSRFLPEHYPHPWTFTSSKLDSTDREGRDLLLEPLIRIYITSQAELQTLLNPSGDLWSGGLNEPKFNVDGAAFEGDWGRPQRDGPAIRALALIAYANYLLDRAYPTELKYVKERLYDPSAIKLAGRVIKNDLEEVGHGWDKEGFDLWEEINGHHFWTRLVSLRALQSGANLAERMGDPWAAEFYRDQAKRIEKGMKAFWVNSSDQMGHWASSIGSSLSTTHGSSGSPFLLKDLDNAPTHPDKKDLGAQTHGSPAISEDSIESTYSVKKDLDCGFLLSIIHTATPSKHNDTSPQTDWTSFDPSHPGVLSTLRAYAISMEGEYPLNKQKAWTEGILIGRYKGDEYDGVGKSKANPWFICTHSFAHVLYSAHTSLSRQGSIRIGPLSRSFWTEVTQNSSLDILHSEKDETWKRGSKRFNNALEGIWTLAEKYRMVVQGHVDEEGSMSEQIHWVDRKQYGARDLTWSHASFLDMIRARREALGWTL